MDIKTVLAGVLLLAIGFGIGTAENSPPGSPGDNVINEIAGTENSGFTEVSVRELKNNPSKWEGEKVIIKGRSNSLKDFIKADGYSVDMDCSDYSNFDFSNHRGIIIYGVVEYIPGEIPLEVRCIKAPKIQES